MCLTHCSLINLVTRLIFFNDRYNVYISFLPTVTSSVLITQALRKCFCQFVCLFHVVIEIIKSMKNHDTGQMDQFSSVTQSCPNLCDPKNRSMPVLPVHQQLPESTQTHVHRVGDAISHSVLCRPLLLLIPIPPSIRDFSNESTLLMR